MKKISIPLVFMLVLLMSSTHAQTDNPILLRIYEDGYSIEQIKNFALQSTVYSANYRKKLLSVINKGLRESGEYMNVNEGQPLTEKHIAWIYDHVVRHPNGYLPAGYSNTYKKGNDVAPTKGKTDYFGPLDRFIFGSCVVNLDKPSCANLLGDLGIFEPPYKGGQIIQQQSPSAQGSEEQKQMAQVVAEKSSTAFVPPKTISEMITGKVSTEQTNDVFLPENKFNWKPVIIIGGTTVAIGTGLLVYSLLKKGEPKDPVISGSPVDPTGPMDLIGP